MGKFQIHNHLDQPSLNASLSSSKEKESLLQEEVTAGNNRSLDLHNQIKELEDELKVAKDKITKEKKLKSEFKFKRDNLFGHIIDSNHCVLIDIHLEMDNKEATCYTTTYLVERLEGEFYLPYEFQQKNAFRSTSPDHFLRQTTKSYQFFTFKRMTEAIQEKLKNDVDELSSHFEAKL
ncbi:hypothetical protein [Thermoactinomyces sp. DSM 45892]|uniref:hypothetical protein n=1 Tax=Thermoactinomyces sp. DSM 45892 TaxID=1882753 RepID=UPI000897D9A4|nr:hypothetical protein [Thermoactinomyces sp. DSM 45892]SDX96915.1 hypothetical protein SAMN05444416_101129 [Thermoactinomyces sp. DSM 45892]